MCCAIFDPRYAPNVDMPDGFRPVPLSSFGGLDLSRDPQDVGWSGAMVARDVSFDIDGQVGNGDGTTAFASLDEAGASDIQRLIPYSRDALLAVLPVSTNLKLKSVSTSGVVTSIGTWAADHCSSFAKVGTPTSSLVFIASQNFGTAQTLRKYDGSTLAASSGKPWFVSPTPVDNRLAQARFTAAADSPTGANGSPSTIFFSGPGTPETFDANDFVHLDPGDGEVITGMAVYGTFLFVFKETKGYVFYGNSTDSTGGTVFNYREIQLPARVDAPGSTDSHGEQFVSTPQGVIFPTARGLVVTTGGNPQPIGREIQPAFSGHLPPYTDLPVYSDTADKPRLSWANDRLFFLYGIGNGNLVWWPATDRWAECNQLAEHTPPVTWSNTLPGVYSTSRVAYTGYGSTIYEFSQETPAGTSFYQTGYGDLGTPMSSKVVRELLFEGTGTIGVVAAVNNSVIESDGSATLVALGTSPAIAIGTFRQARRGRNFALRFGCTDQFVGTTDVWSVKRVVAMVAGESAPGLRFS